MGDDNILTFQRKRYKRKAQKPKESDWQRWKRRYKQSAMDEPLYAVFVTTSAAVVGLQILSLLTDVISTVIIAVVNSTPPAQDTTEKESQ